MNNYFKQLINITKDIKGKSGIHIVSVSHDNWCKKLKIIKKNVIVILMLQNK